MTNGKHKPPIFGKKAWHVLMQNGRCILCGEPIFLDVPTHTFGAFSFEHKMPQVHGGAFGRRNRAGSHNECNKMRKDRMGLKFLRPEYPVSNPQRPPEARRVMEAGGIWWSSFREPSR